MNCVWLEMVVSTVLFSPLLFKLVSLSVLEERHLEQQDFCNNFLFQAHPTNGMMNTMPSRPTYPMLLFDSSSSLLSLFCGAVELLEDASVDVFTVVVGEVGGNVEMVETVFNSGFLACKWIFEFQKSFRFSLTGSMIPKR